MVVTPNICIALYHLQTASLHMVSSEALRKVTWKSPHGTTQDISKGELKSVVFKFIVSIALGFIKIQIPRSLSPKFLTCGFAAGGPGNLYLYQASGDSITGRGEDPSIVLEKH